MKELPSGWKRVKVSDAYWFQEGPGVRRWQFQTSGIKLLNVGNITKDNTLDLEKTDRHLDPEEVETKYKHFLVDVGDLVIASSGISFDEDGFLRTRGAFVKEDHLPLCMNTSTIRFKSKEGISDLRYFRYWLQSNEFRAQVSKFVTGSAQLNFGPSHLKKMSISLPPLPDQQRIAAILDKADALRAKRRAALAKLDTLLQATFLDMFGDPVTNPMGWEVKQFGDVGSLERGKSKHRPRNAPELLGGPYPLVQTGDVSNADGGYLTTYTQTYSELGLKQSRIWKSGVLCITIAANIANTAILTFDACFPDSVVGFIPSHFVRTEYVQYWLGFLQKIIDEKAPQVAQKNINLKILRELEIPVPPIDLQDDYVRVVARQKILRDFHKQHLDRSDKVFHALQQRAFKGEL